MNTHLGTAPMEMHRRTLEIAAKMVERTDAGGEQLITLLTAEVGHTESTVVYEENKLELHRYSPAESEHETPIFIVYALVNRPYILDLQPDRSVVRQFLAAGFEVYLVRWGEPSRLDRSLGLRDYVCRYIDNCVDVIRERSDVEAVHLLGYCMGGTMALMYTSRFQERVRTLGLMATPFAFDGAGGILEHWANHYSADVVVERLGNIPAELLAVGFSMMDPVDQYLTKYVRLFENIQDEAFVANFSRMEQWIWDGVDVPGAVYREFLDDIYTDNKLARSEFELDGEPVDLSTIEVPVLQIVGEYDHIVPPESSKPFNETVASEDERIIEFPAGHIGISVSSKAHRELWPDVCEWLADRDGPVSGGGEAVADAGPAADDQASLERIRGIGPTYARRLADAGIGTPTALAAYDPETLADIAETHPNTTERWLAQIQSTGE